MSDWRGTLPVHGGYLANYLIAWQNAHQVPAKHYDCGFCGASVAPNLGWHALARAGSTSAAAFIYICHHCQGPTFIDPGGRTFPGVAFGDEVKGIDDSGIATLYDEARRATAASAYTAAVLCCRKILMHVGVEKGAPAGKNFVTYVEHLATTGYIPTGAKGWVDYIREKSNEANHEIVLVGAADAEKLLTFTGMLLKVVYEFPAAMKQKQPKVAAPTPAVAPTKPPTIPVTAPKPAP